MVAQKDTIVILVVSAVMLSVVSPCYIYYRYSNGRQRQIDPELGPGQDSHGGVELGNLSARGASSANGSGNEGREGWDHQLQPTQVNP
jgi:hypothetical protein